VPLESYGLPFVFSWLIQSANDADFSRFEKLQSNLPWWLFRPLLPFITAPKREQPIQESWLLADKLFERLPETEEKKRAVVKFAKERFIRTWRMQMTGFVATILLLFAIGIGGIIRALDTKMLADTSPVISNPVSTDATLAHNEEKEANNQQAEMDSLPIDKEREDRVYYDRVVNDRTLQACEAYLEKAPKQTMRQYVENYKQYISKMDGEIGLTMTATLKVGNRIFWGGGSENTFTLSVNGVPKITIDDLNPLDFNSNKTLVLDNNSFPIKGKLTDTFNVKVEMRYNNWRKRDQGSGSKSFTIEELRQGTSLTLTSDDDTSVTHTLMLRADGFPQKPPLPEWRSLSDDSNE
jgi:hypothetical protein